MNTDRTPKTRSVWPTLRSKSSAEKVDVNRHVEGSWASQSMGWFVVVMPVSLADARSVCVCVCVVSAATVTHSSVWGATDVATDSVVCHRTRRRRRQQHRLRARAAMRHVVAAMDNRHSAPWTTHQRHRRRSGEAAARRGRRYRVYFRFRRPLSPVRAVHRTGSTIVVTWPLWRRWRS